MKIFLTTLSCLGLMIGFTLVIGIITPRYLRQDDQVAAQVFSELETEQRENWSDAAKIRWEEVVGAPARNRRSIENWLAFFGGFSVLASIVILWRAQHWQKGQ